MIKPTSIDSKKSTIPYYLPIGTKKYDLNAGGLFESINLTEPVFVIQDKSFLDMIKLDKITIDGVDIVFSQSVWDFSIKKRPHEYAKKYMYDFKKILDDYYLTVIKLLTLNNVLTYGLYRPFIQVNLQLQINFILYLERKGIDRLEDIKTEDIQCFIDELNVKTITKAKYKTSIKYLLSFYTDISGIYLTNDIFEYLDERDKIKLRAENLQNRYQLVPYKYMTKLINNIWIDFNNSNNDEKIRRCASLLYICSQCGLRPGELLLIPFNCLVEEKIHGKTIYKLNYYMTKNVRGKGYSINTTIANDKVKDCILYLRRFVGEDMFLGTGLSVYMLSSMLKNIINKTFKEKEIKEIYACTNGKGINLYSFRVYFASELKRRGFEDIYISTLLGHHDEKMFGYYDKPVTKMIEDVEYTKRIVESIMTNKVKILGPKGPDYQKKIVKYLSKENVKTSDDIDSLIRKYSKQIPIRRKAGGFCIRPNSSRPCHMNNDDISDNTLCAYGICSNQCHTYIDLPYYYEEFKKAIKIIESNKKNNFKQAAQKELYKVQIQIKETILPEIKELRKSMNDNKVNEFIKNDERLIEIVKRIDEIESEVKSWIEIKL